MITTVEPRFYNLNIFMQDCCFSFKKKKLLSMQAVGLAKIICSLKQTSIYQGSFPYILLLLRRRLVIRELKHQAFLTTRTWGDQVETKSKTPFLAPIFVLSTRLPTTDAAAKFKKCKRPCKHWFSRGKLRIRLSFSLHGVF